MPWEAFQRRRPALARAGARFLASARARAAAGRAARRGLPRAADLDDWLVLLEDYALRCLARRPVSPAAAARYEAVGAALRDARLQADAAGDPPRRVGGRPAADRLRQAKALALVEVVDCEYRRARRRPARARAVRRRAAAAAAPDDDARRRARPRRRHGAARAVGALADDARTARAAPAARLRPRACAAPPPTPRCCSRRCEAQAPAGLGGLAGRARGEDGLVAAGGARRASGGPRPGSSSRRGMLRRGVTQALVGTRALLGEGWDAPCVNCLVDLTAATTGGLGARRCAGRSLRLDPDDPEKVASNWDVVCVAPEPRARRAPTTSGSCASTCTCSRPPRTARSRPGRRTCTRRSSPFAPPPAAEFAEINRDDDARARRSTRRARERWAIGTPYRGVRSCRRWSCARAAPAPRRASTSRGAAGVPGRPARSARRWAPAAAARRPDRGRGHRRAARARRPRARPARRSAGPRTRLGRAQPRAPGGAAARPRGPRGPRRLRELGELSARGGRVAGDRAARLRLPALLAQGRDRPRRARAFADRARRGRRAGRSAPRYLVSRLVRRPGRAPRALLAPRCSRASRRSTRAWDAVPADLGRNKERAEAFAQAWRRWLGPGELLFTQRSAEGRDARAEAAAEDGGYETSARRVWD